jgi:predicted nucleotidyltransferase
MSTIEPNMSTVRESDNLASALFGKTRRAILALFFGRSDEAIYLRQAVRETGLAQGAVQRELKRLSEGGILSRSGRGREVFYQANRECPIFEELQGLMAKTAGLTDVVRDALTPLSDHIDMAFIYGSQASGTAGVNSDVDLFVVGKVDEMKLHKAVAASEQKLKRSVNYSLMNPDEFGRRRKDREGFVGRILRGKKILIMGKLDER